MVYGIFGTEINKNRRVTRKGLTTIYEKSLGARAGGSTALVGVLGYAEPVRKPGFVVMG